jgi:large subunit ribosomal protein L4
MTGVNKVSKLSIYNINGEPEGEVAVDSIPEGFVPDKILISRSLKRQLANARKPIACVKTRAEVRGGGRKPFKQKGLGRSRQGSIRSIQWKGGGVAWGPRGEQNFTIGMNKKERKAALRQIIWSKIQDGDWLLFSDPGMKKPSTRKGKAFLESLKREGKFLVVVPDDKKYEVFLKSLRNLPEVSIITPDRLNTFDLLKCDTVLAHERAFETVRETWQV